MVSGPEGKTVLTTGFIENKSHSGEDSAKAYEHKLAILAVLADSTVEEIKSEIDFWLTDRAADNDTLLRNLGAEISQILKCCGHLILGVDNACDKIFRDVEQRVGMHNLIMF